MHAQANKALKLTTLTWHVGFGLQLNAVLGGPGHHLGMRSVTHTIDEVLDSLVGQHTIVGTLLGTADGELLAGCPQAIAAGHGARAARWAADILEYMHGLRAQLPDEDFSIVREKPMYGGAHVLVLGFSGHFLLLSYEVRDCLGGVRLASKEAISELRKLLGQRQRE